MLAALLLGCAARTGLVRVDAQVDDTSFTDDDGYRGLREALAQSVRYYRGLPSGASFRYGDLAYSAAEMAASTELFLGVLAQCGAGDCAGAVREKFLVFESRNEQGAAFFTGYYEPVLAGSLTPSEGFPTPLYAVPDDLVTVDLAPYAEAGLVPAEWKTKVVRGKLSGGVVVPYDDRETIAFRGSLEGRAQVLAWVADDVELFFLQVQGSGLVRLADGTVVRVNYANQNGWPYRSIGKLLFDRIPREKMSLQALRAYLKSHPEEVRRVLSYNPSYVFFRRIDEGPLGNIEVPLTPGRSVAMDAHLVPRGGVAWFETRLPPEALDGAPSGADVRRFGVVQDTGGAITGHGRVDIFWGSGDQAERRAGYLKEKGRVYLLVARKEFLPH